MRFAWPLLVLLSGCGPSGGQAPDQPAGHAIGGNRVVNTSPAIDNVPLTDFLAWVAGQTRRELRFSPPRLRENASHIVLRGSIAGMDTESALSAVMATTPLAYQETPGRLTISAAGEPGDLRSTSQSD